jgi:hypothetical protein
LQHIKQDGTISQPFAVSETANSRSSGFPRMVIKDDKIYLAWTAVGDTLQVQSVEVLVDALLE